MSGLGIDGVMWAARGIGSWPGSTIHLPAFAPWAIVFLSLAVLSSVLWRTAILRATALPLAALGLLGAAAGPSFDMAVAPAGDAVAFRAADGRLAVIGRGKNAFSAEQWLRADADGRPASEALTKTNCDKLGCVGYSRLRADGRPRFRHASFRRGLHPRGYYRHPAFRALGLRRCHRDRPRKAESNRRAHACFCQGRCRADALRPARRTKTVPGRPRRSAAGAAPCRSWRPRKTGKIKIPARSRSRRGCRCVAVGIADHIKSGVFRTAAHAFMRGSGSVPV